MSFLQKCSCVLMLLTYVMYTNQQIQDPVFVQQHNRYQAECSKEVGIDPEYVDKVWNENDFPNDNKLKCFFKCMVMKHGILTTDGEVVDEQLEKVGAKFVDRSTDSEIVAKCGTIQGTDLCDTAMKLMACIRKAELD